MWEYISQNASYHEILMNAIQDTAEPFLGHASLIDKIDGKISSLMDDFAMDYGTMEAFYNSLW